MKELPWNAVYEDVVRMGLIIEKKTKYTMRDFRKLEKDGYSQIDAQFIVVCSAAYHKSKMSNFFGTYKFLKSCELGNA